MPQLDSVTFFTQFFWTMLCLFVFHFCVSKWIVPSLSRAQKSRSKIANSNSSTVVQNSDEQASTYSSDLQDQSPKQSSFTLLREIIALSLHTVVIMKRVQTLFYKNRVQDLSAKEASLEPQKIEKQRAFQQLSVLGREQSSYIHSVLESTFALPTLCMSKDALSPSSTDSSSRQSCVDKQDKYGIQIDANLSARRNDLFNSLYTVQQEMYGLAKKEWIPHGILNIAAGTHLHFIREECTLGANNATLPKNTSGDRSLFLSLPIACKVSADKETTVNKNIVQSIPDLHKSVSQTSKNVPPSLSLESKNPQSPQKSINKKTKVDVTTKISNGKKNKNNNSNSKKSLKKQK